MEIINNYYMFRNMTCIKGLNYNQCRGVFTLSFCIPPALPALITKTKDSAFGRYSFSLGVTSPDPPMPGVSTNIVFFYI